MKRQWGKGGGELEDDNKNYVLVLRTFEDKDLLDAGVRDSQKVRHINQCTIPTWIPTIWGYSIVNFAIVMNEWKRNMWNKQTFLQIGSTYGRSKFNLESTFRVVGSLLGAPWLSMCCEHNVEYGYPLRTLLNDLNIWQFKVMGKLHEIFWALLAVRPTSLLITAM